LNNINLRIISKIGLLFVVIGFFLPVSCNLNGFEIAKTLETYGGPTILSISLYSIFIFSCIGIILLFALLMKYKFSIGYDWADLIIIIIAFSVFIYAHIKSSDDSLIALFNRLQSGAYIIFIGLVVSLFSLIAASLDFEKIKNKVYSGERMLDEDTKKKIAIRDKLFIKIRRMNIIGGIFFFFFGNLIGFFLFILLFGLVAFIFGNWPFESDRSWTNLLIISLIIGYIIALYLTRLIYYKIYGKKTFVYWRELSDFSYILCGLIKKRKNKKEHSGLTCLWYYWDDYYRKGKGILSPTFITIPGGFTAIGELAFFNYTSLTSITIPKDVKSIGNSAFSNCTSLASVTVDINNPNYASQDNILYNKAKTSFVLIPKAIRGNVTIPECITSIGQYAFWNCTSLTSITIPASVTSIDEGAFFGCTSLTSITIPKALTSIGNLAFWNCTSLTSITIPASVTVMGESAFSGWTNTKTINVPFANANAKPSGWDANWNKNCNAVIKYWNGTTWE